MYRRSDDAIITDDTPAEMRLLFPYVIGLSGEFNNTSVALAATNLFTVRSSCSSDACIACDVAYLLQAAWHAACSAKVHDTHVSCQASEFASNCVIQAQLGPLCCNLMHEPKALADHLC